MLLRVQRIAVITAALAITAFFSVLTYRLPAILTHLDGVLTRFEGVESKAYATLNNVDKGTKVWADSAKSQAGAVEDLATDAHGTLSEANKALQGVSAISQHVQGTADAATALLASGQRTVDGLRPVEFSLNAAIERLGPLEDASTLAVEHFDALVSSPDISQALSHVNGMTASGDGILADAKKVADKETADWLKPVPWWKAPIAKGSQLIDITAAIARHTP